jgi:hypothetical protein
MMPKADALDFEQRTSTTAAPSPLPVSQTVNQSDFWKVVIIALIVTLLLKGLSTWFAP